MNMFPVLYEMPTCFLFFPPPQHFCLSKSGGYPKLAMENDDKPCQTEGFWGTTKVVGVFLIYFFHILGIIIPIDELIFFRGVGIPPTRKTFFESGHVIDIGPPMAWDFTLRSNLEHGQEQGAGPAPWFYSLEPGHFWLRKSTFNDLYFRSH